MFRKKVRILLFSMIFSLSFTNNAYAGNNIIDPIVNASVTVESDKKENENHGILTNYNDDLFKEKSMLNTQSLQSDGLIDNVDIQKSRYLKIRERYISQIKENVGGQYIVIDATEENPIYVYSSMKEKDYYGKLYDKYICEIKDIIYEDETKKKILWYHVLLNPEYDEDVEIDYSELEREEVYIKGENAILYKDMEYDIYNYLIQFIDFGSNVKIDKLLQDNIGLILKNLGSIGEITPIYEYNSNYTIGNDPIYMTVEEEAKIRKEMVGYALTFVGNDYVYGGTSLMDGTDCSGFTMRIYEKYGFSLLRSAAEQYKCGKPIKETELKPGDLVFYGGGDIIEHVAMYIGDGKIVHAANSRDGIITSNLHYWNYLGANRIFDTKNNNINK